MKIKSFGWFFGIIQLITNTSFLVVGHYEKSDGGYVFWFIVAAMVAVLMSWAAEDANG